MLLIFLIVIIFDLVYKLQYDRKWKEFNIENTAAQKAGYNKEYSICSRKENVILDGVEYLHFNAHRKAVLDGDYNEELLVITDKKFIDKVPNQSTNLIIFAKEIRHSNDAKGNSYTLVDIYSVCSNSTKDSWNWFAAVIIVNFIGILIELIMIVVFFIHKVIHIIAIRRSNRRIY